MLEEIYDLGRRLSIVGFIERSKEQHVAELAKCSDEGAKRDLVVRQHQYVIGVIRQMFNPRIYDTDVATMNRIDHACKL